MGRDNGKPQKLQVRTMRYPLKAWRAVQSTQPRLEHVVRLELP